MGVCQYEDYLNRLKDSFKLMSSKEFHQMLMTGADYKTREYQGMDELKKILEIVKDDEDLVEKEVIVLREMGRTYEHTKEK
jgi:hypothetical protein